MHSLEHPVHFLFRQAEVAWKQFSNKGNMPTQTRANIDGLFVATIRNPEILTARAQDLDDAIKLFNHLNRRGEHSQNESKILAEVLPRGFMLPTLPQLARNTRQSESFFRMMVSRTKRGDYGFAQQVSNPEPLSSISILAGYSLAVHRMLARDRHAVPLGFDNTIISGLSTMINPQSPLYRDIFQAPS